MRGQFTAWTERPASADTDPYAALAAIEINGVPQDVLEGVGAMRAYEAMMYGVEKHDVVAKDAWRRLLQQLLRARHDEHGAHLRVLAAGDGLTPERAMLRHAPVANAVTERASTRGQPGVRRGTAAVTEFDWYDFLRRRLRTPSGEE